MFVFLGVFVLVGDGVCYVVVVLNGFFLVVSCYGDGCVVWFVFDGEGCILLLRLDVVVVLCVVFFGDDLDLDVLFVMFFGDGVVVVDLYVVGGDCILYVYVVVFFMDGCIVMIDFGFDLVCIWCVLIGLVI